MSEQEKCRLCDRKKMRPFSSEQATVAWIVTLAYLFGFWNANWGPDRITKHSVDGLWAVFALLYFIGIAVAIWFGVYVRRNVIGTSSVRYRDGEVEHDHAHMPTRVGIKFHDHRDQEIRGLILQSPDCGWFRRVHVHNVGTYSWKFSRARKGMIRMRTFDEEMTLYPSCVMRMFSHGNKRPPASVEYVIADAMEHDGLQRQLNECRTQLTDTRVMCDTLGQTIAAVTYYVDLTKKRQRAEIAGHAKDLLIAGLGIASIEDLTRNSWDQQAEHMLGHLEKEFVHTTSTGMEPTHV